MSSDTATRDTIEPAAAAEPLTAERITLRTLRRAMQRQQPFAMLTCYDATTADWLWRGGVGCMLVGDTAAQVILGHDSTLPAPLDFMVTITAGVRRGAPDAFIMADMPFGSYQCGDDLAMANAARFLTEGAADVVKMEVAASHAPLVKRMSDAGIPVVAHIGSRPQTVRAKGGYGSVGKTRGEAKAIVEDAQVMLDAGAAMLLIEAVPAEVSEAIVAKATPLGVPVVGCGGGPACHGHVVVLQDLLGLSGWQPPFVPEPVRFGVTPMGPQIEEAARAWDALVRSGRYLKDNHPYRMRED